MDGEWLRTWRAQLPFGLAALLAFPLALLPPDRPQTAALVAAAVLTVVVAAIVVTVPWDHAPALVRPVPALLYLVVIGLLRHAEGGAASGYAALVILPLFWVALHGTRSELVVVIVGIGVVLAAPVLLFGAPRYPVSEWRRLLLWLVLAPAIGGAVQHLVGEVREATRVIDEVSRTDPLTQVPNRRGWEDTVRGAVARSQRDGSGFCLAVLDIDHFKRFNDAHGHAAGDRLLTEAAQAWSAELREVDTLARWGGEEFVVLVASPDVEAAARTLERVRAATPLGQTVSIGLARYAPGDKVDVVLARADAALYEAKGTGRDRLVVAGPSDRRVGG